MQYTYASILCAICAAVFRSAITNHDIREYYSHSILFVLAILLYFPYRFLKIAIANINQCLQKEIVPSEEEKENKAVGLVKSKTLRIQQDTAIKFHTMVIAVIIIVILFISMAAMNNFSSVNTTSSLDVNFRTSKLTSMGQPVFKNMGNTSIENLHVKIVRKNRSFGPESIIPSLKSGEEIILPRGDGWVVERGDSVIVEHEGNNKRLTFQ